MLNLFPMNGVRDSQAQEVLEALQKSDFEFVLTGSRFFGSARIGSDWDFFVQFSPEVTEFLVDLGFRLEVMSGYDDPMIEEVWRYNDGESAFRSSTIIDVQVVNNAKEKLAVQRALAQTPRLDPSPTTMEWDQCVRAIRHMKFLEKTA